MWLRDEKAIPIKRSIATRSTENNNPGRETSQIDDLESDLNMELASERKWKAHVYGRPANTELAYGTKYYPASEVAASVLRTHGCKSKEILRWFEECVEVCAPDFVHFCDGSAEEYAQLAAKAIESKSAVEIPARPGSLLFRTSRKDTSFIEPKIHSESSATNNSKAILDSKFPLSMRGRVMYAVPYSLGPVGSPNSINGIQLTDSIYVVLHLHMLSEISSQVYENMRSDGPIIRALHSMGQPLLFATDEDVPWPYAPSKESGIWAFPNEGVTMAFGSTFGYHTTVVRNLHPLIMNQPSSRIAHPMACLRITNPDGRRYHACVAGPTPQHRIALALQPSSLPGWTTQILSLDAAWIHSNVDTGTLQVSVPEMGITCPVPSSSAIPLMEGYLKAGAIYTNTALTSDGDVWWEGQGTIWTDGVDWEGYPWEPTDISGKKSHPLASVAMSTCDQPEGSHPLDFMVFVSDRDNLGPVLSMSQGWNHGLLLALLASNTGTNGVINRDPMMGGMADPEHLKAWVDVGNNTQTCPRIVRLNLGCKEAWPGDGENSRLVKWMCERLDSDLCKGIPSPIGMVPNLEDIGIECLLNEMDVKAWSSELDMAYAHINDLYPCIPEPLVEEYHQLHQQVKLG